MSQPVAPQALDVDFAQPLCPGVIHLVDPSESCIDWESVVDCDLVLHTRFDPLEGTCCRQCLQTILQVTLRVLEFAAELSKDLHLFS
jgi:hypothetical protein